MTESLRHAFADQINDLEQDVIKMGSTVEQMLSKSIEALIIGNINLADSAIEMDDIVDDYNWQIENDCLKLLALQQPMAKDLRIIAASLKIITDIERMGDYVVDIARAVKHLYGQPWIKPLIQIPEMAERVKKMLRKTLEAYVGRNTDLIKEIIKDDDHIDKLYLKIKSELLEEAKTDCELIERAIDYIMIARYLERLGDHLTNVCERIYYMETGVMKELH